MIRIGRHIHTAHFSQMMSRSNLRMPTYILAMLLCHRGLILVLLPLLIGINLDGIQNTGSIARLVGHLGLVKNGKLDICHYFWIATIVMITGIVSF